MGAGSNEHAKQEKGLVKTWNSNKKNNNCYAFAFDHLAPNADHKLQPGQLSGMPALTDDEYSCPALTERVLADNPGVRVIANGQECRPGERQVALFLDNTGENRDYHFYRRMDSGRWAHKPGSLAVSWVDDAGNVIRDPLVADRDYVNDGEETSGYNYDQFCTKFCVPIIERPKEKGATTGKVIFLVCIAVALIILLWCVSIIIMQ